MAAKKTPATKKPRKAAPKRRRKATTSKPRAKSKAPRGDGDDGNCGPTERDQRRARVRDQLDKRPPSLRNTAIAEDVSPSQSPRVWRFITLRCEERLSSGEAALSLMAEYGVSESQAQKDGAIGNKLIAEGLADDAPMEAQKGIRHLDGIVGDMTALRRACIAAGDSLGAAAAAREGRQAQREISLMLGTHAPKKVDLSGNLNTGPDLSKYTDAEKAALEEALRAADGRD